MSEAFNLFLLYAVRQVRLHVRWLVLMLPNVQVLPFVAVIVAQCLITNKKLKMEKKVENKQLSRNDGNTVLCAGREYKTKFKEGDRVTAQGYCGVLVLDSVDEMLTSILHKLHWNTVSENYLQGKSKTNNGEVYSESELSPCT